MSFRFAASPQPHVLTLNKATLIATMVTFYNDF